ncbi:sodium:proton antiporter [Helicovermis profundi]|uniref:NADH-quinone oxidoreductase subunit K n=1 Tax=Helicovermis profundi TaxID=3065157 RepID=A0AAU9E7P5_9FIRM|nr:NADH-quinone oxidoreductase subunit K [Clostridia bacterium S502]
MIQYVSILLMLIGIYGLLINKNIIKIIVALNIFEVGLNIFIISVGFVSGGVAPILTSVNNSSALIFVDPLPQALVLTSIVIGLGTTALALGIARKMYTTYNSLDLEEIGGINND